MKLLNFLEKNYFLQDLIVWLINRVPAPIHHNIEKIKAIRRAFAYTGQEGIKGDYLEFGVFQGTSLIAAINAFRYQNDCYGGKNIGDKCRFIGCDSFEGLRREPEYDKSHPVFDDQMQLAVPYDMVVKRLRKYQKSNEIKIVKGYYCDTLPGPEFQNLGIKKLRVVFFDCDLKSSTQDALKYSAPYWQEGTVLIFDDFFAYKGNLNDGEHGAFKEFCEKHPEFTYRHFGYYGFDGVLFVVVTPPVFKSEQKE